MKVVGIGLTIFDVIIYFYTDGFKKTGVGVIKSFFSC